MFITVYWVGIWEKLIFENKIYATFPILCLVYMTKEEHYVSVILVTPKIPVTYWYM